VLGRHVPSLFGQSRPCVERAVSTGAHKSSYMPGGIKKTSETARVVLSVSESAVSTGAQLRLA
jgi:hypothetical protein